MIQIILGSICVGLCQCLMPFIDRIPLLLLKPLDYIILKILIWCILSIIISVIVVYNKKHMNPKFNFKTILLCFSSLSIAGIGYMVYIYLIKQYSPGEILPILVSSVVILSLFLDYLFFGRKITKKDVFLITTIGLSIFFLTYHKTEYDKNININWIRFIKN